MHPILIDLGFFQLPTYGVLIATAVLVGLWTLRRRATHAGMDPARIIDLAVWVVIWALIGAKLLLVIVEWPRYSADPAALLGLVRAGGVFLGGFLAGLAAGAVLLRRYRLPAFATLDTISPSIALGHAIGRLGCLMAGCCWGAECHLPWALTYTDPQAAINVGTPLGVPLHPFPIYASIFNFLLWLVLEKVFRSRPRSGLVFALYLGLYGLGRFSLEFTRGDAGRGFVLDGLLSTSQAISLVMIVAAIALALWRVRHREP
jgi:phosphatidylglycerol:prolipoprotein diacylglycerol transferase